MQRVISSFALSTSPSAETAVAGQMRSGQAIEDDFENDAGSSRQEGVGILIVS